MGSKNSKWKVGGPAKTSGYMKGITVQRKKKKFGKKEHEKQNKKNTNHSWDGGFAQADLRKTRGGVFRKSSNHQVANRRGNKLTK